VPERARRVSGRFPLLQMQVNGMRLDIQYARSSCWDHPVHWASATCDDGGVAAAALRDTHAVRQAVLRHCGMDGVELFQRALKKLKWWAKSRCIDCNALGFLGGFSWSVLLAKTLLDKDPASVQFTGPGDATGDGLDPSDTLVVEVCHKFSTWPWPKAVSLTPVDSSAAPVVGGAMPILCPTETSANSARNVTASTCNVLRTELDHRARGGGKKPLFEASLTTFVRCRIVAAEPAELALASQWLEARLLWLVKKLDAFSARPLHRETAPYEYIIGTSGQTSVVQQAVDEFQEVMTARAEQDGENWLCGIDVQVCEREGLKADFRQVVPGQTSQGTARSPP